MDSLERFPVVWSDSAVVFSKAAGPSIPLISSVGQPPNQASMKGKLATKTHTKDNKVICKAYNDSRGCANPCRKGSVHCCDVELQKTKQACGQKHPRSQHDQQAHGGRCCPECTSKKGARRVSWLDPHSCHISEHCLLNKMHWNSEGATSLPHCDSLP